MALSASSPSLSEQSKLLPSAASTGTATRPPLVRQYTGSKAAADARQPPTALLARGSVLSSVVNLCTATLGAGCLALPWAMSQCGLLFGLAMLLLAAFSSKFTIRLLVRLYAEGEHTSFESLAARCFGSKGAALAHFTLLTFCFGAAVAVIMVVGDVLQPIARILLPTLPFLHEKTVLLCLLTAIIMLPLSFFTHVSSLRVMSLLATLGIVVLAVVFTLQGSAAIVQGEIAPIRWVRPDTTILLALPIVMFAFSCQANIFSILEEQIDQRRETDFRVVNFAVSIETIIYCVIGTFGYLMFGDDCDGNVLRNLDMEQPTHVISQLCVGVSLCLSYPLCIYPARFTLLDMFWPEESATMDIDNLTPAQRRRTVGLTLALVVGSLLFAIFVPSISELFTLLGSTTGALIGFILPTAMYLRLGADTEKQATRRAICKIMLAVTILLALLTTARSMQFIIQTKAADLLRAPPTTTRKP